MSTTPPTPTLPYMEFSSAHWQQDPLTNVIYPPWIVPSVPTENFAAGWDIGPDSRGNWTKSGFPACQRGPTTWVKKVQICVTNVEIGTIAGASYRDHGGTLFDFRFTHDDQVEFCQQHDVDIAKRHNPNTAGGPQVIGVIILRRARELDVIASNVKIHINESAYNMYEAKNGSPVSIEEHINTRVDLYTLKTDWETEDLGNGVVTDVQFLNQRRQLQFIPV